MPPPRRKKWTEAEERTLIDKYEEMVSDGSLGKMKNREKKFRPISFYVNSMHHAVDPVAYPWQWTWKDVSTKVQNMRHQYLLVKQKIRKPESGDNSGGEPVREEFDWVDGIAHWSNFLRYKDVFGDVALVSNGNDSLVSVGVNGDDENSGGFAGSGRRLESVEFGHIGHETDGDFVAGIDSGQNGILVLGFDYEGDGDENFNANSPADDHVREDIDDGFVYEEVERNPSESRKKQKVLKGSEKRAWGFLGNQLHQLRQMETRFEQCDAERDSERQRRQQLQVELEKKRESKLEEMVKEREEREKARERLRRQWIQELEAMDKKREGREMRRREEELIGERDWEERMNRRRLEWQKSIDEMLAQHRAAMGQVQSRILHEQQSITNQLLGIISQWTGHPTGLADHTGASNHYLSQMMQNLQHVNGMVHSDTRVDGENQDEQFIVDG